jgi:hypothetical protein
MKFSMKFSIFLACFSQFCSSTAFSFFHKPPLVVSRCNHVRTTSLQAPLSLLQGNGFASTHKMLWFEANRNVFRPPNKRNSVEGCSRTAKASDRDDSDDFWEMGDITEKLDKTIQPAARVSVRCTATSMTCYLTLRHDLVQRSQETDTVMSRGIAFGESLSDAIEAAVLQAAQKIPASNVPGLAVIFFSSAYSEQG